MCDCAEHEILVSIVREHPRMLLELLGRAADEHRTIEVVDRSENLTQLRAAARYADAVLVLHPQNRAKARAAFIVEVQLVVGEAARKNPDFAVLSLLAHRHEPAVVDTGRALLIACRDHIVDGNKAKQYADIVLGFVERSRSSRPGGRDAPRELPTSQRVHA